VLNIVFEDKDILVINKAAGVVVTSEGVKVENSIEEYLRENFEWAKKLERAGIVHRLDKGTSGIMVIAKNELSQKNLKKQFKERKVRKTYVALIGGDTVMDGEIKVPIKRSKYGFGKWGVSEDGKEAWTIFRTIQKYKLGNKIYSLVEINLKTGRTHQIRVHFSYLRWPLVGDRTYGGEMFEWIGRPFLHAKRLEIEHPGSKKKVVFEAELPNELKEALRNYEKV